jgi:hypothetical protein
MDIRKGFIKALSAVTRRLTSRRNFCSLQPSPIFFGILSVLWIAIVLSGCTATLSEKYYLATHDPDSGLTNYFRITTEGNAFCSSAKYSVGFYDRTAVERLFGETSLEHEYRSTRFELFGADNKRLNDISAQLTKVAEAQAKMGTQDLIRLNAAIAEMIARYKVRLKFMPNKAQHLETALRDAEKHQEEARKALDKAQPETIKAQSDLRMAYGLLQEIRTAVDGRMLVRFFDGAGNEIDVTNKTQVIFVASDASRFLEALRQLAEDEVATQDVMLTILGPRIKEAQMLTAQVSASEQEQAALLTRLDAIIETLTLPQADIQEALKTAAVAVGGTGQRFSTPDEIHKFLKGATAP